MAVVQLGALGDDRTPREQRVPAAVVEVQVAVHDQRHVVEPPAVLGQRHLQVQTLRAVPGLGLLVRRADPRVEQHQSGRVRDGVRVDRLDLRRPAGLLRRADERTEEEASDVVDLHGTEPSAGRSAPSRWRSAPAGRPRGCRGRRTSRTCRPGPRRTPARRSGGRQVMALVRLFMRLSGVATPDICRSTRMSGYSSPKPQSALTAFSSLPRDSLASPKNSVVVGSKRSSFSMPAKPGRIERFMKMTCLASSALRIGMP